MSTAARNDELHVVTDATPPAAAAAERRTTSPILNNVTSNWAGIVVGILLSFVLAPLTVNSLGNVYYGIWTLLPCWFIALSPDERGYLHEGVRRRLQPASREYAA